MGKRVLVVDDSRFVFEEMKYKMGDDGEYQILYYCPNGEAAVEAYEEYKPDLVTVDIVMPGIDGIETTRRLLRKDPHARIVVTTSMVFDDTMDEAKEAGALGFLAKPFERDQMIKSFDSAFAQRP